MGFLIYFNISKFKFYQNAARCSSLTFSIHILAVRTVLHIPSKVCSLKTCTGQKTFTAQSSAGQHKKGHFVVQTDYSKTSSYRNMIPATFREIFGIFCGTSKFVFAYSTISRGEPIFCRNLRYCRTLNGKTRSKRSVILYHLRGGKVHRIIATL
jgi:hypothetical protein